MKAKKKFNNAYFFDTLILMYLFKKGTVSTDEMEKMFGSDRDWQNVNNVISNKKNSTSFVGGGFMEYDGEKHTLTITEKGKRRVRKWFSKRREYAKK